MAGRVQSFSEGWNPADDPADEKKATDEKEEKIVGESDHLCSPLDPVDVISIGRVGHPDFEDLCALARTDWIRSSEPFPAPGNSHRPADAVQGQGPYSLALKKIENELKDIQKRVGEKMGVRESDTGLASPNLWDTAADRQRQGEHPYQVARCQTIIKASEWGVFVLTVLSAHVVATPLAEGQALNPQDGAGAGNPEGDKYVISIKQVAKFVVGLGDRVSPTDVEEGMRVGWVDIIAPRRI